ncbi:hypothetical protein [Blastococcus sp. CT_GayMR16]|uniref:hypothetical protein n=1 Tax=Blastococcus sp. CT_GayMR16 TaxID=2559607 RepID=UPI001FD8353C|nr:hypothetical protein [Blastococcus sp. CT_GayMR16]
MTSSSSVRPTAASSSVTSRRVAAAAIAAAGILHLVLVPEYLAEAPLIGVLFLASAPLTGWAAWRLWRREDLPAWLLGAAVSAGMIGGFLLSRTVGFFGYSSAEWAEGIPSLLVEGVFLAIAARHVPKLLSRSRATSASVSAGGR